MVSVGFGAGLTAPLRRSLKRRRNRPGTHAGGLLAGCALVYPQLSKAQPLVRSIPTGEIRGVCCSARLLLIHPRLDIIHRRDVHDSRALPCLASTARVYL